MFVRAMTTANNSTSDYHLATHVGLHPNLRLSPCENHAVQVKMPSTHKKVIVRKLGRDTLSGFVSPSAFIADGKLELMTTSGNVVRIDLAEIKCVYFVRDFNDVDIFSRKTFTTRPRTEGLWVRLHFKDNDLIEGLMPNDLTALPNEGYLLTPPDTRGNTQRIFVPRSALASLSVLAVIGGMQKRRRPAAAEEQVGLFNE